MEKQLSISALTPSPKRAKVDIWTIHIDGAARGNPGPAGAGVLIEHGKHAAIKEGIYLGEKNQ